MTVGSPTILVVTHDAVLAQAVMTAAPAEWTEWRESLGSALATITPMTRVLVMDAALDAPLAHLLATLFVDREPGRRAVLIHERPDFASDLDDDRITVLAEPISPETLAAAVSSDTTPAWMSELEASLGAELCIG